MTLDQWLAAYGQAWHGKDDHALTDLITADDLYRSSATQPPHRGRRSPTAGARPTPAKRTSSSGSAHPPSPVTRSLPSGRPPGATPASRAATRQAAR